MTSVLRNHASSALETTVAAESSRLGATPTSTPKVEVVRLPEGQLATKNNRGQQMSTISPLFDAWIAGAANDATGDPVAADLGCAYGINSLEAARRGVPTVLAMDVEDQHLTYTADLARRENLQSTVHCMKIDYLPRRLPLDDESVSSLLVGEVLHFLTGVEIKQALRECRRVLKVGGVLCVTMCSGRVDPPSNSIFAPQRMEEYCRRMDVLIASGDPLSVFPGEVNARGMEDWMGRMHASTGYELPKDAACTFLHVMDPDHLRLLMEDAGLRVTSAAFGKHPGYASAFSGPKANTQVVAVKI